MARVLLLGKYGQVGSQLNSLLSSVHDLTALGRVDLDLADKIGLQQAVQGYEPDIIINAAAYTDVDKAEAEPSIAQRINTEAPRILGREAAHVHALLIHFSTDYVFDGTKGRAYTEQDPTNPINVYGHSKLAGEQFIQESGCYHFILRTSWVYSTSHPSFVSKVLSWARSRQKLRIVKDQIGSPTWSKTLAQATIRLVDLWQTQNRASMETKCGTYHVAGVGSASRFALAKSAIDLDPRSEEHTVQSIKAVTSDQFSTKANRPINTSLDSRKFEDTFDYQLPPWEEALRQALLN